MMADVKTTYRSIEIEYSEDRNLWCFTLDDKDRTAQTLANAKKAIDAPGRKKFDRFEAYRQEWAGCGYEVVTVTGLTENSEYVWISRNGKGSHRYHKQREKVGLYSLYVHDDANRRIIDEMSETAKQIEELRLLNDQRQQRLKKVKLA
jgi:hypothetical protein